MPNTAEIAQNEAPQLSVAYCEPSAIADPERIIVIGSGPVGLRFANELLKRKPHAQLTLFGNEPWEPNPIMHTPPSNYPGGAKWPEENTTIFMMMTLRQRQLP